MNEQREQIAIRTPEFVSIEFQLAGLGSRAVAFMIDQFIVFILNMILYVTLFFVMDVYEDFLASFTNPLLPIAIVIIITFVINVSYFFVLEYATGGRTIGKKVMGIRVIQENGHSITLLSSFIRNFIRIIDSLPAAYFIGIVMIFAHSKHKRLGDVVAGTLVVHERGRKRENKRKNVLQDIIDNRIISKDDLNITEWQLQSFQREEWQLLKSYCERFTTIDLSERSIITRKLGEMMLPKIGESTEGKKLVELENMLLALYLHLKEEWEYEI